MSSISEPVLPLALHFFVGFIGPAALIIGSTLVMAAWRSRFGSILALVACAWLTVVVGSDCYIGFHREPLQARPPYGLLISILIMIICADAAALILFCRVAKPSNQALQPTAGRRDDQS
jgi:hypothetical protein